MSRDPVSYPDGDDFRPERWLKGPGETIPTSPDKIIFGFGRRRVLERLNFRSLLIRPYRICPGRYLAENSVRFITRNTEPY